MADPRAKISFYEKQLVQRMLLQEHKANLIFSEFISSISPILKRWKDGGGSSVWIKNRAIEKEIEKQLNSLHSNLSLWSISESSEAWKLANAKNNDLVNRYIGQMALTQSVREGLFTQNINALNAFQTRKAGGLDLSQRVWNIAGNTKEQLGFFLESGLATGRSAAEISRDVRQVLHNPDKSFRRVRDPKTGKLILSKPMKNFHPGQGVYRSPYKNALRLTATETNMAYRRSDHERWKKLDFVTGYEVKLSASHPVWDICDSLVGKYPKSFLFVGFHPGCICFAVPELIPQDDFVNYLFTDQIAEKHFVKTIPSGAVQYLKENTERFLNYKNTPYWLKDNFSLKNGMFVLNNTIREIPSIAVKTSSFIPKSEIAETPQYIQALDGYPTTLEDEFFDLFTEGMILDIHEKSGGAHCEGLHMHIFKTKRWKHSDFYKKSVIYHEGGHAIHNAHGIIKYGRVEQSFYEVASTFKDDVIKGRRSKNNPNPMKMGVKLRDSLQKLRVNCKRGEIPKFLEGYEYNDINEMIGKLEDVLNGVTHGKIEGGFGHERSYWKDKTSLYREVFAHMMENQYAGNPVFKRYAKKWYDKLKEWHNNKLKNVVKLNKEGKLNYENL